MAVLLKAMFFNNFQEPLPCDRLLYALTNTYGGVVAVRKTLVFSNPEKLPLFGFAIPRTFHDLLVQIF